MNVPHDGGKLMNGLFKKSVKWLDGQHDLLDELVRDTHRGVELFSSFQAISLGIFLLMPWNTFESSSSYVAMHHLLPEIIWGIMMLFAGILQILSLMHVINLDWRKRTTVLMVAIYGFWAAAIITSNPRNTGVITYSILAISQIWARVRLEARIK